MTSIWINQHSQSAYEASQAARYGETVWEHQAMETAIALKCEANNCLAQLITLMGEDEALAWHRTTDVIPTAWSWTEAEARPVINALKAKIAQVTPHYTASQTYLRELEETADDIERAIETLEAGADTAEKIADLRGLQHETESLIRQIAACDHVHVTTYMVQADSSETRCSDCGALLEGG